MTLFSSKKEKKSDTPTPPKTTQGAFRDIVHSLPRPSSRAGKPRSSSRAAAPNGLTRLFGGNEFSEPSRSPAVSSSRSNDFEDDEVIWHQGPQRSVAANTHQSSSSSQRSCQAGVNHEYAQAPAVPPKTAHGRLKQRLYPQSVEHLYVECGIVSCYEVDGTFPANHNQELELWAFDNPVAAMHIMELARKWGLRAMFADTCILTNTSLWKKTAPAHREKELAKSRAAGDRWIDDRLANVGRSFSKHVVQKQGLQQKVKNMAYDITRQEVFASSDLSPPKDKGKGKVVFELPNAVTALYCDVAGLDLGKLPEDDKYTMIEDWSRRLPVSDYHLKRVIEKWSPEVKRIQIDPVGFQSLKAELGSPAVEKRARGLSNVDVSGRAGRSVPTQGRVHDEKSFRMRVMNM